MGKATIVCTGWVSAVPVTNYEPQRSHRQAEGRETELTALGVDRL
jgi:hypothetical protein